MPTDRQAAAPMPAEGTGTAQVAILMCTRNGAQFIDEQLQSIAEQTHARWSLYVSDDDSTDETVDIVRRFAEGRPQQLKIRSGPGKGACANFLSLAVDPTIEGDFFAFSDQDDIWHKEKLQRALDWLTTIPGDVPAFCCSRTELATIDGQTYDLSPLFTRKVGFGNAIIQSLGGANTIMFNRAAKRLVEKMGALDVVLHDWWIYQLVSAVGGAVRYDPQPTLKYRQHSNNEIGSNKGWYARLVRMRMVLTGRFREWNAKNTAALQKIPADLITPENRRVLELFSKARTSPLFQRLYYLKRSGVYRQTTLGNIGLWVAAVFKKI